LQGSLQGSLSHSSEHNLLQCWWTQAQSQGSCNKQYNYCTFTWQHSKYNNGDSTTAQDESPLLR
jgi:hypothetical protein